MARNLLVLSVLVLAAASAFAQDADPLAVLKSDAPQEQKHQACIALSVHGTVEAVPVLAAMLTDEKLSHMARYALEPMPFPEAGAALRDALGKTSGRLQVGVLNSLAVRKDVNAVPVMIGLLSSPDPDVAQEAARALGVIGQADGIAAVQKAVADPALPAANQLGFCHALLIHAESDVNAAPAIYDFLLSAANVPVVSRAAALRGKILAGGSDLLLADSLKSENKATFNAAVRAARELPPSEAVTSQLASVLPRLSGERKIIVMQALGHRGDAAAGPALMAEAKEGAVETRVAALNAMTRIKYAPALELMQQLVLNADTQLAKAARDGIAYFPGDEGDVVLRNMLETAQPELRLAAIQMVAEGGLPNPVDILVKAADDQEENVRIAALKGLQDTANAEQIPVLLDRLLKNGSQAEMQATEKAIQATSARIKRAKATVAVEHAVYGDLPDGPSADVTETVAQLVMSGTFAIEASNAKFGDTAPGKVKKLTVTYVADGIRATKTATEGETIDLGVTSVPSALVDGFVSAFNKAGGEARLALLRLLGSTGSPTAMEVVVASTSSSDASVKDTAFRTLCGWPNADALPAVMDLARTSPDDTIKVLALRGAVRLIGQGGLTNEQRLEQLASLMQSAATSDAKKTIVGGLAEVHSAQAFEQALRLLSDETVRLEAIQAARTIARNLGGDAREETGLVNGTDLSGWEGHMEYWRFEDGAIVGDAKVKLDRNNFLWPAVEVGDFYMAVDVKLEPPTGNGGIQFRSKKADDYGQALGYQADVGQDVWGRVYHEHGRGKLDWSDGADAGIKAADWNHYEILAVGPAIWLVVNGKLGAACLDFDGERTGLIGLQLHGGIVQKVQYKNLKLVHNPKVEIEGISTEDLIKALKPPLKEN